jgi:predicted signal transduction protein with EAL and GGDEF domain
MTEKQSDILARLRDPMKNFDFADRLIVAHEIEKLRKAADELEDMRAVMDQSVKLALSAVHAERAAILELIEVQRADAHLYNADYALKTVAAAIRARGEQP